MSRRRRKRWRQRRHHHPPRHPHPRSHRGCLVDHRRARGLRSLPSHRQPPDTQRHQHHQDHRRPPSWTGG
ncbi:hypothetical protein DB30_01878 [Enhygromyxa salina]|uniref:Uncharacterized protein n=1 Tax=Enhygromyxa salina TaxID=215803 RepID=A0A0C1Z3H3_9BACT|nr:hypothetical protein DB30_01878 [Enhygromyxa salina]